MLKIIQDARREERKAFADTLRALADRFENGEVSNVAVVANDLDEACYWTSGDFDDCWRLIGAFEWAKARVVDGGL